MMRRGLIMLALVLAASGCGDSKKTKSKPKVDAGSSSEDSGASGGGEDAGEASGGSSSTTGDRKWIQIKDAPNCEDDDLTTPGTECVGSVTCGGTAAKPWACPLDTHSCCVSGLPMDSTVNCYEGKTTCPGIAQLTPCDGPEDCNGGEVCCVTPPPAPITSCTPAADCDQETEGTVLCHTDEDCPAGTTCVAQDLTLWWGFCG